MSRVDVRKRDLWPVNAEASQTIFHQVHDEPSFGRNPFGGRVAKSNDGLVRQATFG